MLIVSQDRTFILDNPKIVGYEDSIILALEFDRKDLIELGSYELETTPLVFEKIIDAFKKGEKVFEMPEVC